MDASNGALTPIGSPMQPNWSCQWRRARTKKLFTPSSLAPVRVLSYAIDPANGRLTQKASAPLRTACPMFLRSHRAFPVRRLLRWDKIAVSPMGETRAVEAEAIQVILTGRNPHSILPDPSHNFATRPRWAPIWCCGSPRQRDRKLTPNAACGSRPGRRSRPSPYGLLANSKNLYVLNELSGHVTQYAIDAGKGTLTLVDSISSVPKEAGLPRGQIPVGASPAPAAAKDDKLIVWAADIQITPNGKFLYSTERTTNKIALFTVAADTGKLTYVTNYATEAQPRGIRIDPTGQYLIASGEKSDRISVYKIDQATGKLGEPNRYPVGNGANWVEIVELQ